MTATQLNGDVILDIIENVYFDSNGNADMRTLHSMTLVSKQWARCTSPYLWHHIDTEPQDDSTITMLLKSLSDPNMASRIVMLALVLRPGRPFAPLILACPRLYELRVLIKQQALEEPLPVLPNVRSLVLEVWPTMSRIPFQILQQTPNLRCLRLQRELASWPPALAPPFKLYELSVRRPPKDHALAWLLRSATDSLVVLESYDVPGPAMRSFLAEHGAQLQSLRVFVHSFAWRTPLRACVALKEYKMVRMPTIQPLFELPKTIEHLAFANQGKDSIAPVTRLVKSLPNLRIITHDAWSAEQDDFLDLRNVCEQIGVALRVETFPFWNCEDAVEVDRFPRTKSLSNSGRMR
ncbi:hypothetical protein EXIGLDRAFT_324174 [Exidia glandulosa HHB12029]|uniref:F-box domain-containing protein n=1 Tax=Exidia glandulosa HHB12029 TaxID=1314781 RepID=A0A165CUZ7_EXIGL|nr:hypothetical protein EXIGLDRAFT_324174 [Exidia glandulosa HHB12029]